MISVGRRVSDAIKGPKEEFGLVRGDDQEIFDYL
jgi:hypothetical protein